MLYKSEDIVEKILIDLTDKVINEIIVNDKKEYKRIEELKKEIAQYAVA